MPDAELGVKEVGAVVVVVVVEVIFLLPLGVVVAVVVTTCLRAVSVVVVVTTCLLPPGVGSRGTLVVGVVGGGGEHFSFDVWEISTRKTKSLANSSDLCPCSSPAPPPNVKISPSLMAELLILTQSIKVPFMVAKSLMYHW